MSQKKPSLSLDSSLVQDDIPVQVVKKIFLGSIHAAFNLEGLMNCGITHILNASRIQITFPNQFTYLSVDIRDKEDSNILACIPTSNIFIEAGIDRGAIFVHCFGGKSRSPAFIVAFLMSTHNSTFDEACKLVRAVRPSMEINIGFECQLRAYYAAKFDVYLAQQLLLRSRIRDLHLIRNDSSSDLKRSPFKQKSKESIKYEVNKNLDADGHAFSGLKRTLSDSKDILLNDPFKYNTNPNENMDVDACSDAEDAESIYMLQQNAIQGQERDTLEESIDSGVTTSSAMSLDQNYAELLKSETTPVKRNSFIGCNLNTKMENSNLQSSRSLEQLHSNELYGHSQSKKMKAAARSDSAASNSSLTKEAVTKFPSCRLSRPGCQWIRIIPPLRGLERDFKCSWCDTKLFQLANVIRIDLNVTDMMSIFQEDLIQHNFYQRSQGLLNFASKSSNVQFTSSIADSKSNLFSPRVDDSASGSNIYSQQRALGMLPPISKSASSHANRNKKQLTFSNGVEMDVDEQPNKFKDEDDLIPFSGLKTSRAASSRSKSFNFDFSGSSECTTTTSQHNGKVPDSVTPVAINDNFIMSSPRTKSSSVNANSINSCSVTPSNVCFPKPSHKSNDESPRVHLPPLKTMDNHSFSNNNATNVWTRPKSAEQRRWLARMNLLNEGNKRVLTIAEEDVLASQHAFKNDKYLYIEYLDWMGKEIFSLERDCGDICCPNCKNAVGKWFWTPSNRLLQDGKLEAPLFCIPKQVLYHTDVSLDPTPLSTPRDNHDIGY